MVGTLSLTTANTSCAQDVALGEIISATPDRANAILYMDVPTLRKLTEGNPIHTDLSERLKEVRIASDIDLSVLQPNWEIGYVTGNGKMEAQELSKMTRGYVDTIAGKSVVWSQQQSYLIPMPDGSLGVVRPADRKLVGRWLKKEKSNSVASYLQKHSRQDTKFISMMIAVDLEDAFSAVAIQQRIETLSSLKGTDTAAIANTLASIQGVRVIVGRKNLDECIISMDFGSSPEKLLPVAKEFFVELLARNSSSVPESSGWKSTMDGNTISFRGTITAKTIDDMLGIFTLQRQASDLQQNTSSSQVGETSESIQFEATKAYYEKTANILKRVRDYSADNTGDRAQWNGRMARRIDELPTLNVDPEVIEYGVKVSQGLRGNMVALQTTNISTYANAIQNGAASVSYGGYNGGYYNDANAPYQYRQLAQAQGNYSYRELIGQLDQLEADMRRKLTAKYKVQF